MSQFSMPNAGKGFQASFSFSSQRQRPLRPGAQAIEIRDPACDFLRDINPAAYATCVANSQSQTINNPVAQTTFGGLGFRTEPRSAIQTNVSFNVTPSWSAQWNTTYDLREAEFASHMVTLQRELHDWRAIFGFTQAPNGNFAFNFFISLKAQPDIKFEYDRQTYRPAGGSRL